MAGLTDDARRMLEDAMRDFQRSLRANADRLLHARDLVEASCRRSARASVPRRHGSTGAAARPR